MLPPRRRTTLNKFENPVYPEIKAPQTRYYTARNRWKAKVDALYDAELTPTTYGSIVRRQSKEYGSNQWGRNAARLVVNKEFRPPLLVPAVDFVPLSRLRRPVVQPRVNPGGLGSYHEQNIRPLVGMVDRALNQGVRANVGMSARSCFPGAIADPPLYGSGSHPDEARTTGDGDYIMRRFDVGIPQPYIVSSFTESPHPLVPIRSDYPTVGPAMIPLRYDPFELERAVSKSDARLRTMRLDSGKMHFA